MARLGPALPRMRRPCPPCRGFRPGAGGRARRAALGFSLHLDLDRAGVNLGREPGGGRAARLPRYPVPTGWVRGWVQGWGGRALRPLPGPRCSSCDGAPGEQRVGERAAPARALGGHHMTTTLCGGSQGCFEGRQSGPRALGLSRRQGAWEAGAEAGSPPAGLGTQMGARQSAVVALPAWLALRRAQPPAGTLRW